MGLRHPSTKCGIGIIANDGDRGFDSPFPLMGAKPRTSIAVWV